MEPKGQFQVKPPAAGVGARQPIVYLPIEFRSCEFDSKILLATTLANRGYPVVIGQQWLLYENFGRLPSGVILFKSFNKIHHPAIASARQHGHRIVILDEEMLAQSEERAVEVMCPPGALQLADTVLVSGEFEREIMARLSGDKTRIEITGNGRVDILKPRYRVLFQKQIDEIKARFGDFVLVNTNFAVLNSVWESVEQATQIQIAAGTLRPDDPDSVRSWNDYIAFEQANRDGICSAVRELARKRPKQRIVVRPHPGEDLKRWDGVFADHPNVSVVREGPHVPWTMASRVLLHTSCTTGFEAQVAGTPALSFTPRRSWLTASLISNAVNPTFDDVAQLLAATEHVLDGGAPPRAQAGGSPVERYVWNYALHDASEKIADILLEGMPSARAMIVPALVGAPRDRRLKTKFEAVAKDCIDAVRLASAICKFDPNIQTQQLGESLFVVAPAGRIDVRAAPKLDAKQIRAAMAGALQNRQYRAAYDIFKQNFGEAHPHGDLCFHAGMALFELGEYRLALQYFEQASLNESNVVNINVALMQARTHQKLGQIDAAQRYADLAYNAAPTSNRLFGLRQELSQQGGRPAPKHWVVIGCSHVRYFRYMQANRPRFFGDAVHLETYDFSGATAFGLASTSSTSGALTGTRQAAPRIAMADKVLVYFGEIDCRRAAWKAAETSGQPIEQTIAAAADHLQVYLKCEILPHNKNVLIVGAKPQIVGDKDFFAVSQIDERTIFKPLEERERITGIYNARLKEIAAALKLDYLDIDHVLADAASRKEFFANAFWDGYTDDTHGNVDYFAQLYFEKLKPYVVGAAKQIHSEVR